MFNLNEWIKDGLKNGYREGIFSLPYITTMTANYIVAGLLVEQDAQEIAEACAAWDEEQAEAQQPETLPEDGAEPPEGEESQPDNTEQPASTEPEEPIKETEETV